MRYLLDTHTFLWFLLNNDSLSKTVRDIIEDSPILYLSIVSLWEIAIKTSIHKLNLKNRTLADLLNACKEKNIQILPITPKHIEEVSTLPFIHRAPFDRMLVAQAKVERMTLITHDQYIPQYPIETFGNIVFGGLYVHDKIQSDTTTSFADV